MAPVGDNIKFSQWYLLKLMWEKKKKKGKKSYRFIKKNKVKLP